MIQCIIEGGDTLNIGQIIKNRREELGMTQDELAIKVGYKSRSSINKIEIDGRGFPQSKLKLFAKALDISPYALIDSDSVQMIDTLVNQLEDGFDTVLFNIGYSLESLDNGYVRITLQNGDKLTLTKSEYEQLQDEVNDYIRYKISKLFEDKKTTT